MNFSFIIIVLIVVILIGTNNASTDTHNNNNNNGVCRLFLQQEHDNCTGIPEWKREMTLAEIKDGVACYHSAGELTSFGIEKVTVNYSDHGARPDALAFIVFSEVTMVYSVGDIENRFTLHTADCASCVYVIYYDKLKTEPVVCLIDK